RKASRSDPPESPPSRCLVEPNEPKSQQESGCSPAGKRVKIMDGFNVPSGCLGPGLYGFQKANAPGETLRVGPTSVGPKAELLDSGPTEVGPTRKMIRAE